MSPQGETTLDRQQSSAIVNDLISRFMMRADAEDICGIVCDEYTETKMDNPLLSEKELIDIVAQRCPEVFGELRLFVDKVFIETGSFQL